MNIGIITSFLVGGLLLLSIFSMNSMITESSVQMTMDVAAKSKVETINRVLSYDMDRMGYNVDRNNDVIQSMDSTHISFYADLEGSVELISWEFQNNTVYTASRNPNDYHLVRKGPVGGGKNESTLFSVNRFSFTYYDKYGAVTANPDRVKKIKVQFYCESPEPAGTNRDIEGNIIGMYSRSFWQRTYVPVNIQYRNN